MVVLIEVDGGGTAKVICEGQQQDPLYPDKVILQNIQALSWPVGRRFMKVTHWSVPKSLIKNWMAGPIRENFEITPEMLNGEKQQIPHLPGTLPSNPLANHPDEVEALVEKQKPAPAPQAAPTPAPEGPPPARPVEKKVPRPRKVVKAAPEAPKQPQTPPLQPMTVMG